MAAAAAAAAVAAAAAGPARERGRHYPHSLGLPIQQICEKVHRDLSNAIGPIAATYALFAGCSVWNLFIYLCITSKEVIDIIQCYTYCLAGCGG